MQILKKLTFIFFTFLISLSFISCGYKPSSYYAKKEMEAELKAQGKPEQIWDKIIPGQLERFIADNTQLDQQYTLLSQFYVMDDKKTIAQDVEAKDKELGGKIQLLGYVRFELGEGLAKRACDFASEVAEQLK